MVLPARPEVPAERLTYLDGARGVAAFAVVLSHVAFLTYAPWFEKPPTALEFTLFHLGAPAVDFFFVLSGLVVARAIMRGGFTLPALARYVARRVVRLLPVAWLAVLLGLGARALAGLSLPDGTVPLQSLTRDLSGADWVGFVTVLWPEPDVNALNPPLWTLIVEMQMVLLMPLLAWIAARRNVTLLLPVALPSVVVSVIAYPDAYLVPMFALGALIGAYPIERGALGRERAPRAETASMLAGALFAAGLALLLVRHVTGWYGMEVRWLSALGAGAMIVALPALPLAVRALNARPLQWLGNVSFSLYATHFPVLFAVSWALWQVGVPVTLAGLIAAPLTLPAAWLAWRAVELPALRASRAIGRRGGQRGADVAGAGT